MWTSSVAVVALAAAFFFFSRSFQNQCVDSASLLDLIFDMCIFHIIHLFHFTNLKLNFVQKITYNFNYVI